MTPKQLLIYLHPGNPELASWATLNETGAILQSGLEDPLENLQPFAATRNITVLIPGQDVLLTFAELPKLSRQRLVEALPFALEEKLIGDIHDLHFAIGDYQPDNTWPTAVITKKKMNERLQALKDIGITPTIMLPMTLVLPYRSEKNENEIAQPWYACYIDDVYTIRTGKYKGIASDKDNVMTMLQLLLAEPHNKPTLLCLYYFREKPIIAETLPLPIEWVSFENHFFENIVEWLRSTSHINLLQPPYQAKQKSTATKKVWLITSCLAIGWIGLLFLSNIVSYFILHQSIQATNQAIYSLYHEHFPAATSVVAPRERIEEKLKKTTSETDKNTLLTLLAIIGKSLNQSTGIRLAHLDFRNRSLHLTVNATSFTNLDSFTKSLTALGLSVKQQSASMKGSEVKASLIIHKGGL